MIKVHIAESFAAFGLNIAVVMHPAEGSCDTKLRILRFDGDGRAGWPEFEPSTADPGRPTFALDDVTALALLDALTRHYHGADDTRALRKDYNDERVRVDRLIGMVGVVAEKLCAPPTEVHYRKE